MLTTDSRPDFVAILGVLTRAEIEDLATRTAAHRHARHLRHHPPPTLTPQSSDIPPKQPPRPGSSFKPIPVPIPVPIPMSTSRNRREDTPSSTDYTNSSDSESEPSRGPRRHSNYRPTMRKKMPSYAGSDTGSIHGYPNAFGQPVPPPSPILSRDGDRSDERERTYRDISGNTTVFNGMPRSAPEVERDKGVRFGNPSYYTHEPQQPPRRSDEREYDRDRHRVRDWESNRERVDHRRERHSHDHHRSRDHDRSRDERKRRERDSNGRSEADRGPNKEVEQMKKKRWKENLTAAGIGGAAVSLLNVLSEAAEGI